MNSTAESLLERAGDVRYGTIYADPPWRFSNRTTRASPEYKRIPKYETMDLDSIKKLPVSSIADPKAHLYLWVPNAMLPEGLEVMKAWGFDYKTNIVWEKVRKDGRPDGSGTGFYFRNVTEMILFGIRRGSANNRTLQAGRTQVNLIRAAKREHSRKPDELIPIIEECSRGPRIELFARGDRDGWTMWGNQATTAFNPDRPDNAGRWKGSLS